MASFYDKLITSDWLDRNPDTYMYKVMGDRIGWEKHLQDGAAYSSFLINLRNRALPLKRKMRVTHHLCSTMTKRLNPNKKPIKLNFSDTESFTDTKSFITVNVSSLGKDMDFPTVNHQIDPVLGFVVHEMAHVLYTDNANDDWFTSIMKKDYHKGRLMHSIFNVIEDERIENHITKNYMGYSRYLEKSKQYIFVMCDDGQEPEHEFQELFAAFVMMMRFPKMLKKELADKFSKELEQIVKILTPYPETASELKQSVIEIYEIFKKYFEEFKEEQEKKSKVKGKGGKGDSDNDSDDSGDGSGGDIDPDSQEGEGGESKGDSDEKDSEEGDDSEGEEEGDGEDSDGKGAGEEVSAEEMAEALGEYLAKVSRMLNQGMKEGETVGDVMKEVIEEQGGYSDSLSDMAGMLASANYELEQDKESTLNESLPHPVMVESGACDIKVTWRKVDGNKRKHRYQDSYDRVNRYASALRGKIMQLNRAMDVTHTNLAEGQFNHDDLVPALMGSKNVYKETYKMMNRGCVVGLLCDESGSMAAPANNGQRRDEVCRDVAVMFELALRGINNVDFYCFGHTTNDSYSEDSTLMRSFFDGRKKGNPNALGEIQAMSGNRDGHAVLESVARIRNQHPKLPIILFVVSDGEPTDSVPHGFTPLTYNQHAIRLARTKFDCTCIHLSVIDLAEEYEGVFDLHVNLVETTQYINEIGKVLRQVMLKQQKPIMI